MAETKRDLVVIGGGPGGYVGAIRAAQLGLNVALVEKDARLGGTCLLRGCIPTKALLHSAELCEEARHAAEHGIRIPEVAVDMPAVMKRKQKIVQKSAAGVNYLMKKNKIEVVRGEARLESPQRVVVRGEDGGESALETRHVLIATGSVPRGLPGIEFDGTRIVTSNEMLELTEVPESLIVLGAGAVGVEFACAFAKFGSRVTVVELLPRLLPLEDEEVSLEFERAFRKQGIACLPGTRLTRAAVTQSGVECTLSSEKKGEDTLTASLLLVAVGRAPYTDGLGAREVGLEVNSGGFLPVDEYQRTNVAGISAIGDVVPTPQLAHVASAEAIVAVEHLAGAETRPVDYATTPGCTYSLPEVASVGLSEERARQAGHEIAVGKFPFQACGKARVLEATAGFVKIVADKSSDRVLGVHIIGPRATELIAEAGLMIQMGCTAADVARLMHAHPTLSEAVMEAAHGVHGNPIHL